MTRRLLSLIALCLICSVSALAQSNEMDLGAQPAMIGRGIISSYLSESAGTLMPDGKTLYYGITDDAFTRMTIVRAVQSQEGWQPPEVAAFSGVWNDSDPYISPKGDRLFFISNRPDSGEDAKPDLDIWYVDCTPDGAWGDPIPLEETINSSNYEIYPSIAEDGTLYFARPGGLLFRAQRVNNRYPQVEQLPFSGGSPAIAPDQSFIIFTQAHADNPSNTDLYVSFNQNGTWSTPQRLADPVNSPYGETAPRISADGKTLLFSSNRVDYGKIAWPRPQALASIEALRDELEKTVENGLRNMYWVDLSRIYAESHIPR